MTGRESRGAFSADAHGLDRAGRRFDGHDPAAGHDTGGLPWEGRSFTPGTFDSDDGSADPDLARLIAEPGDGSKLLAALATARVLVPIVGAPADDSDAHGPADAGQPPAEASSDLATVTLTGPDGSRALPAFTCLDALALWDAQARPVPVTMRDAARAALEEGCDVIALDVAGPTAREVTTSQVVALANGWEWKPPHEDPVVGRTVSEAVTPEAAIAAHRIDAVEPAHRGVATLTLGLRPGLDEAELQAVVGRVGERIAAVPEARARIDGLRMHLVTVEE